MTKSILVSGLALSLLVTILVRPTSAEDKKASLGTKWEDGGCVTFMDPENGVVKVKKGDYVTLHVVNECQAESTIAVARSHDVYFAGTCMSNAELELKFGTYARFAKRGQPKDRGRFVCYVPRNEVNRHYYFTVTEGGRFFEGKKTPIVTHVLDIEVEP